MSTEINIKKKLAILEEGVNITTDALSIDFVGAGVSSSDAGGNTTITIPGGSGTTTYYLNQSLIELRDFFTEIVISFFNLNKTT